MRGHTGRAVGYQPQRRLVDRRRQPGLGSFSMRVRGEVDPLQNMELARSISTPVATDEQRPTPGTRQRERKATQARPKPPSRRKATKAVAAQNSANAGRQVADGALEEEAVADKWPGSSSPAGGFAGAPTGGYRPDEDLRFVEVFTASIGPSTAVSGGVLGTHGRRERRRCCGCWPASNRGRGAGARTRSVKNRIFRAGARHAEDAASLWENIRHAAPDLASGPAWSC